MTVATTARLSYDYRSNTVRMPYCRRHGFALLCTYREQENRCYWKTTDPAMSMGFSVMSHFAAPNQKVKTQIPIARLPSLTACQHPAVSSLEACKTPAR